jgi:hypothetical protein
MRLRLALLALCVLSAACGGSTPAPSDARPLPPPVLSGHVSDLNTDAPLAGVVLSILDGPNAAATRTSDAQGNFFFGTLTLGGFTLRARLDGYDSVFQGVIFFTDTTVSFQMRPAMQTLSGTWTGALSFVQQSGTRSDVAIPQLTLVHSGAAISSTFLTSGPYQGSFSATLADPSAIGSTTATTGTITVTLDLSGRPPSTCSGTSGFTGTVSWTHLAIARPRIAFECGTTFTDVTISLVRQQ